MIDPVLSSLESPSAAGIMVKDLVASFLLPEVERLYVQQRVELEERRFVEAARRAIISVVDGVVDDAARNVGHKK